MFVRGGSRKGGGIDTPGDPPGGERAGGWGESRRKQPPLRGADGGVRRARRGGCGAEAARLPRDRHLGAVDRGDGAAHPARRREPEGGSRGLGGPGKPKPPLPWWGWARWWGVLGAPL